MGLAGQVDAELLEYAGIDLGENDGGVDFQTFQVLQLVDGRLGIGICDARNCQRDQQFVQVQERRVVAAEVVDLHVHDRRDDLGADQFDLIGDARQLLERVEKKRGRSAEQF